MRRPRHPFGIDGRFRSAFAEEAAGPLPQCFAVELLETEFDKRGRDTVELGRQDSGQRQIAAGTDPVDDIVAECDEQMAENVRAYEIVLLRPALPDRRVADDRTDRPDAVQREVFGRDPHCVRIVVEGIDRVVAAQRRRNGQDAGAAAGVEHAFDAGLPGQAVDRFQAVVSRCMLSGSEAHAGIDLNDRHAGFALDIKPARLDDQRLRDRNDVEIFFPDFRPVLFLELERFDGGNPHSERRPLFHGVRDQREVFRRRLRIGRVDGVADPLVLLVLKAARFQLKCGEHFGRQVEVFRVVYEFDAVKHVIHDVFPSMSIIRG